MSLVYRKVEGFSDRGNIGRQTPAVISELVTDKNYEGFDENHQAGLANLYLKRITYKEAVKARAEFLQTNTFMNWEFDTQKEFLRSYFSFVGFATNKNPGLMKDFYRQLTNFEFFRNFSSQQKKEVFENFLSSTHKGRLERQEIVRDFITTKIYAAWDAPLRNDFIDNVKKYFNAKEKKDFSEYIQKIFLTIPSRGKQAGKKPLSSIEKLNEILELPEHNLACFDVSWLEGLKNHHQRQLVSSLVESRVGNEQLNLSIAVISSESFLNWDHDNQRGFLVHAAKNISDEMKPDFFENESLFKIFSFWDPVVQQDFLNVCIKDLDEKYTAHCFRSIYQPGVLDEWGQVKKHKFLGKFAESLPAKSEIMVLPEKSEAFVVVPSGSIFQGEGFSKRDALVLNFNTSSLRINLIHSNWSGHDWENFTPETLISLATRENKGNLCCAFLKVCREVENLDGVASEARNVALDAKNQVLDYISVGRDFVVL